VAAEAGCWEKHIPLEVVIPEVLTPGRTIRDLYEDNADSFPHRWPSLSLEGMTSKGWQAGMWPPVKGRKKIREWKMGIEEPAHKCTIPAPAPSFPPLTT
jgi:hypothetical protein